MDTHRAHMDTHRPDSAAPRPSAALPRINSQEFPRIETVMSGGMTGMPSDTPPPRSPPPHTSLAPAPDASPTRHHSPLPVAVAGAAARTGSGGEGGWGGATPGGKMQSAAAVAQDEPAVPLSLCPPPLSLPPSWAAAPNVAQGGREGGRGGGRAPAVGANAVPGAGGGEVEGHGGGGHGAGEEEGEQAAAGRPVRRWKPRSTRWRRQLEMLAALPDEQVRCVCGVWVYSYLNPIS